ncbi:MAG: FGGY-family carbohydrate kinase, partial [Pseudomonadota bacterium]
MVFSEVSANVLDAFRQSRAADLSMADLIEAAAAFGADPSGPRLDLEATERLGWPVFDRELRALAEGAYAVMQAVAERLAEHLRALCGDAPPDEVMCLGGGAQSAFWRQLKQRATGARMRRLPIDEPTCRGAAVCAVAGLTDRSVRDIATQWSDA